MTLGKSLEDYLETILILKIKKGMVRSIDVADYMGFSKPRVSHAVKQLKTQGFLLMDNNGQPVHLFLISADTSIAYKKRHPLYLFVKYYISNVRYRMSFSTFRLFFFDFSYINFFMFLVFFQFVLCTDQSFSGSLSVIITILGRRHSHFLFKYFAESK